MVDVLRSQLVALKAQIDAMLAVLDSVVPGPTEQAACPHLETDNVGTFGVPKLICTQCKATVPPV